jgi:hypothetical protein
VEAGRGPRRGDYPRWTDQEGEGGWREGEREIEDDHEEEEEGQEHTDADVAQLHSCGRVTTVEGVRGFFSFVGYRRWWRRRLMAMAEGR